MKIKNHLNREYIKATNLFNFCIKFNVYFFKNLKTHFLKILLCDIIFVAQLFTTLTIFNMKNFSHDAKDKNNLKNKKFFINEIKSSKT